MATARAAAVAMPWHASSTTLSSATRCLRAWYDASARPNEYRSPRYSRVMPKTLSRTPVVSAHCSVQATSKGVLDLGGGVAHRADDGVGGDGDVVEAHLGEAADEVEP